MTDYITGEWHYKSILQVEWTIIPNFLNNLKLFKYTIWAYSPVNPQTPRTFLQELENAIDYLDSSYKYILFSRNFDEGKKITYVLYFKRYLDIGNLVEKIWYEKSNVIIATTI